MVNLGQWVLILAPKENEEIYVSNKCFCKLWTDGHQNFLIIKHVPFVVQDDWTVDDMFPCTEPTVLLILHGKQTMQFDQRSFDELSMRTHIKKEKKRKK